MQALVADHPRGARADPPLADRRLVHPTQRMPIEVDHALALAAADQHLEPLHRHEQLEGLNPIDGDAERVVVSEIAEFRPILPFDRLDSLVFALAIRYG